MDQRIALAPNPRGPQPARGQWKIDFVIIAWIPLTPSTARPDTAAGRAMV
jgi:hypothetical protein